MTNRVYRSAQGKQVDMGALALKNEYERAVGNMNVNARGDVIDGWNNPVDPKTQQAKRYHRQTSNLSNEPVTSAAPASAPQPVKPKKPKTKAEIPATPEDFDDEFEKPVIEDTTTSGLAGAIARARELRSATTSENTVKKI
jgi:hypothetical protein